MARILDKLVPSTAQRMVKLRQKQDWLKTELNELAGVYEAKKQRVLDGIIVKSNKKLVSLAKECYAQDYASAMMEDKLQKYDVKTYLSHRAVNHKAAKSIFESIKSGEDWSVVLKTLKAENDALLEKRNAYVKKLEAKKTAMISKSKHIDASAYETLNSELEDTLFFALLHFATPQRRCQNGCGQIYGCPGASVSTQEVRRFQEFRQFRHGKHQRGLCSGRGIPPR